MPSTEELQPMMAAYGSACFVAATLETNLRALLANIEHRTGSPADKIRVSSTDSDQARRTLGTLFDEAKNKEFITSAEERTIKRAIQERNFLIHAFWRSRIMMAHTEEGRDWIINCLQSVCDLLGKASDIVLALSERHLRDLGVLDYIDFMVDEHLDSEFVPPEKLRH